MVAPRHVVTVSLWWPPDVWFDLPDGTATDGYLLEGSLSTLRGLTEDGGHRPAEARWRIRDDVQRYDPDNELSDLYGLIGARTPVRVAVDTGPDFYGEVVAWKPGTTTDYVPGARGYRYVDVVAAGLLRRITRWPKTLYSPMRRYLARLPGLAAYWPCEDGDKALHASSAVPGLGAAAAPGIKFAQVAGPDGSTDLARVETGAILWGTRFRAIAGQWRAGIAVNLGESNPAPASPLLLRLYTTTGWVVELKAVTAAPTGWQLWISNPSTGVTDTLGADWTPGVNDPASKRWSWFTIAAQPGGTGQVQVTETTQLEEPVTTYRTLNFGYDIGTPTQWRGPALDKTGFGHVVVVGPGGPDLADPNTLAAFAGFRGERAADRIARLCAEEGIGFVLEGDAATTQPMGPQPPGGLWDVLRECQVTDDGVLAETPGGAELWYRTRRFLYRPPVLALQYPADVAVPFTKITDDVDLANVVTVGQRDGGESTATLTAGPTGTTAIGEERRAIQVNVADESELAQLAQYHLAQLSQPGARYPSVVIDAQASPELAEIAQGVDVGDLVTVAGFRPQTIWLRVLSTSAETSTHRRRLTLATLPAPQAHIGTWGATAATAPDRYDVAGSKLAGDLDVTTSTFDVTGPYFALWSRTALPYYWTIRGEQVRVTAMSAPLLTGGQYRQTATVARSVNGARRSHTAGTAVSLYVPVYYGR